MSLGCRFRIVAASLLPSQRPTHPSATLKPYLPGFVLVLFVLTLTTLPFAISILPQAYVHVSNRFVLSVVVIFVSGSGASRFASSLLIPERTGGIPGWQPKQNHTRAPRINEVFPQR